MSMKQKSEQLEVWKSVRKPALPPNKTQRARKGDAYSRHQKHKRVYSPFDDEQDYHQSFA